MKLVRFRREAEHDLRDIVDHYERVAPAALPNVTSDLFETVELLRHFPAIGMRVERRAFRRIVTPRYKFKIAYLDEADFITVLGIFRYQNRER